jgi:DNA-binding response OmpR family regulator
VPDGEAQRVLVVDDEPDFRFLLAVMLEAAGYEVIEAPHGEAALTLVRTARPQLVITDRMMPVMGGEQLITSLRADKSTAGIPIIMVTATPGGDSRADTVLMKPFERAELVELVTRLMATA